MFECDLTCTTVQNNFYVNNLAGKSYVWHIFEIKNFLKINFLTAKIHVDTNRSNEKIYKRFHLQSAESAYHFISMLSLDMVHAIQLSL